mmetsp:Transcript_20449/g.40901  ORF Transcript_20449/g.40901 Transcript_20449/m.40901 type:complete len:160 (-) Transcript_20449:134-613(-)
MYLFRSNDAYISGLDLTLAWLRRDTARCYIGGLSALLFQKNVHAAPLWVSADSMCTNDLSKDVGCRLRRRAGEKKRAQYGSRAPSVCVHNASPRRHGSRRDWPGTKTAAPPLLLLLRGSEHHADPPVRRGAGRNECLGGEWPCGTTGETGGGWCHEVVP